MANDDDDNDVAPIHMSTPDPALRRLEKLVGTWRITGRTLDSEDENISGQVTIEWLLGGFFLQQRGEIGVGGLKVQSLEIVGYEPSTKAFPSYVYSSMDSVPRRYQWDVAGNSVTHWTDGAKYTGTFSEDGTVLSGGWRPEEGKDSAANVAYDATMTRMDSNWHPRSQ
ncbi:MAG: DUF1579 family protein [Ktedonobacterales bacterium]